jgi:hypothetical protein
MRDGELNTDLCGLGGLSASLNLDARTGPVNLFHKSLGSVHWVPKFFESARTSIGQAVRADQFIIGPAVLIGVKCQLHES